MITQADLANWRQVVPWSTDEQVKQDLVLSRLIDEIANHSLLGEELVFRGGTCFHKLWLDQAWRYSEDLDYVRRSAGGVGDVLDALREVAEAVGFDRVQTSIGQHPKARFDATFAHGGRMRIKIEMNTFFGSRSSGLAYSLLRSLLASPRTDPTAGLSSEHWPTSKPRWLIPSSPPTSTRWS